MEESWKAPFPIAGLRIRSVYGTAWSVNSLCLHCPPVHSREASEDQQILAHAGYDPGRTGNRAGDHLPSESPPEGPGHRDVSKARKESLQIADARD